MKKRITAHRYHDFSTGHRVYKHESKCAHLHGHNYRIHFYCEAPQLDSVGRVMDFGDIKTYLCNWLEDNWDHKFLIFKEDPWVPTLKEIDPYGTVVVNFNPTAENMGLYLLDVIGPLQLKDSPVRLYKVIVEETRKCAATIEEDGGSLTITDSTTVKDLKEMITPGATQHQKDVANIIQNMGPSHKIGMARHSPPNK